MYRLESLEVWKVSTRLARSAYRLTLAPPLRRHFGVCDQIRRSASSIPANLAEGYGLGTRAQLVRCARISLGSAYELRCHMELVRDLGLVSPDETQVALNECTQSIRLLIGLLKGLQSSQ